MGSKRKSKDGGGDVEEDREEREKRIPLEDKVVPLKQLVQTLTSKLRPTLPPSEQDRTAVLADKLTHLSR